MHPLHFAVGKGNMPRIKGLGELDWCFEGRGPIYPSHSESYYCLALKIELNAEFDSVGFPEVVCAREQFTNRGTGFFYGTVPTHMEEISKLREVAYAAKQLSALYPGGVRVGVKCAQSLRFTIAVPRDEANIQWPTKFISSIARKIERSVKEYRALKKASAT